MAPVTYFISIQDINREILSTLHFTTVDLDVVVEHLWTNTGIEKTLNIFSTNQMMTYSGQSQSPFFISTSFPLASFLGPASPHCLHCLFLAKFKKLHLKHQIESHKSIKNSRITRQVARQTIDKCKYNKKKENRDAKKII